MIYSLRGTIVATTLNSIVIECHGVGYEVFATPTTIASFVRGDEGHIFTSQVIKEDSHTLYGFVDLASKDMFGILQQVQGVGAKVALSIQSVLGPEELAQAVVNNDLKTLQRVPGVGKKMAEKMVLFLKDKVGAYAQSGVAQVGVATASVDVGVAASVLEAMESLGFQEKQAAPVVTRVIEDNPDATTAQVLRMSLAAMAAG